MQIESCLGNPEITVGADVNSEDDFLIDSIRKCKKKIDKKFLHMCCKLSIVSLFSQTGAQTVEFIFTKTSTLLSSILIFSFVRSKLSG